MKASIDSIESLGLVDGPGIRVVVFFNGCKLRCKYCHNPEMWQKGEENYTPEELVKKILRYKPYFQKNGGVTFSGGEPLLHGDFIIQVCKLLKKENVHIALDTAGVGIGNYEKILKNIDLVLLDIKHIHDAGYHEITGGNMEEVDKFIKELNKSNAKVWVRQVVIPNVNDNSEYIASLIEYLKQIKHIEKVEFLPFHRLGREKYTLLGLKYPYEDKSDMDKQRCSQLYNEFAKKFWKNY